MQNGTRRTIVWDEENRIQSVADNGQTQDYKYDDAGERVIKCSATIWMRVARQSG